MRFGGFGFSGFGFNTGANNTRLGSASAYSPEATAYFAAMSVQPDDTRKALLNTLINGLISDGVWALLDWISFIAAHDAQAARINAKTPAQVATVNGTPPFTTDRGYTGDFVGIGYLTTGINDNATTQSTQNSSSMFAWMNNIPTTAGALIGLTSNGTSRVTVSSGVNRLYRSHSSTALTIATAPVTGLYCANRPDASNIEGYLNGVSEGSAASASAAPVAATINFLNGASAIPDARIAAAGFGASLNSTLQTSLYNRLNTYLTAIGGA